MNQPSMLKAAVIGGVSAGVLSSIPLVSCLNILCCALVIGGGFLAGFLYSKESEKAGVPFGTGQGAKVGLLAAPFYALTGSILGWVVTMIMGKPDVQDIIDQIESGGQEVPPEAVQFIEMMVGSSPIMGLIFGLVIGGIFCTVGGLIAGAVMKKEPRVEV